MAPPDKDPPRGKPGGTWLSIVAMLASILILLEAYWYARGYSERSDDPASVAVVGSLAVAISSALALAAYPGLRRRAERKIERARRDLER